VKEGAVADHFALLSEGDAALADRLIESIQAFEIGVDQRLVDELPKMLGRLQLGTVSGLKDEADAVGNGQAFGTVPAGVVELKNDALRGAGAGRLGEVGENAFEHFLGDCGGDVPDRAARFLLDKAGHVEPFEPMMACGDRPRADRRPDSARDRLQAKAMLIHRPKFDFGVRVLALLFGGRRRKLLWNGPPLLPAS